MKAFTVGVFIGLWLMTNIWLSVIASSLRSISEAGAAAGCGGVRSSAVVRPPSSGGQPERETGGQLRIRPPSAGRAEGESEGVQPSDGEGTNWIWMVTTDGSKKIKVFLPKWMTEHNEIQLGTSP